MTTTGAGSAGSGNGPTVEATNRSGVSDIDTDRWARVAVETLMVEEVARGHLDLTFVDQAEMTELNETHMGHPGPTDVLSFPIDGESGAEGMAEVSPGDITDDGEDVTDDGDPADPTGNISLPLLLGDVVICPQVAFEQAPDHCGDSDTELTLLVVHGVLHVLGHDHREPGEEMAMVGRETEHLRRYGLIHPGPVGPESPRP